MSDSYINRTQWTQLLAAINPNRVGKADGLSHVEAYEVRAHLNRIFGFGRWSEDVTDLVMLYEQSKDEGSGVRWRAAYRAGVRLTICAPDGTVLATYTEHATGSNFGWLPDSKRDETHDMAIKTAASQAFKRCATNLGDQFGLSLYNKGSLAPLVGGTIVAPTDTPAGSPHGPIDSHITESLAPEDPPAPQPEAEQAPTPPAVTAAEQGTEHPDGTAFDRVEQEHWAAIIRDRVVKEAPSKPRPRAFLSKQLNEAGIHRCAAVLVPDAEDRMVSLETLILGAIKDAA